MNNNVILKKNVTNLPFYIPTEGNDSNSVRKTMRNGGFACLLK